MEPDHWADRAACQGMSHLFISDDDAGNLSKVAHEAKRICLTCPVLDQCRNEALKAEWGKGQRDRYGIQGGLSPSQRWRLERDVRANTERAGAVSSQS